MNLKYPITITAVSLLLTGSLFAAALAKPIPQAVAEQPLTYANVVSFFKSARLRATEVQKRCTIFFEGEWKDENIYNYCLIIVENSDKDTQITFYLTDAHEMNWITEFIDSPFFTGQEKQALFGLLNHERGARAEKVGRFKVDLNQWHPRHAEIIVFSFTPTRIGG
jgi:hypothetical protein